MTKIFRIHGDLGATGWLPSSSSPQTTRPNRELRTIVVITTMPRLPVAYSNRVPLQHYIATQRQHRQTLSLSDQLMTLQEENGVEYDPRYLDSLVPTQIAGTLARVRRYAVLNPGVARTNHRLPRANSVKAYQL